MTTLELKNNFHQLIDSIENENLLQKFYELMLRKRSIRDGALWAKLTQYEVDESLRANEARNDPKNLLPHDEMKKKYAKWL